MVQVIIRNLDQYTLNKVALMLNGKIVSNNVIELHTPIDQVPHKIMLLIRDFFEQDYLQSILGFDDLVLEVMKTMDEYRGDLLLEAIREMVYNHSIVDIDGFMRFRTSDYTHKLGDILIDSQMNYEVDHIIDSLEEDLPGSTRSIHILVQTDTIMVFDIGATHFLQNPKLASELINFTRITFDTEKATNLASIIDKLDPDTVFIHTKDNEHPIVHILRNTLGDHKVSLTDYLVPS